MVRDRPLSPRQVLGYLRRTSPWSVDTTLLTVADRLSAKGGGVPDAAIEGHLELAREMLEAAVSWDRDGPPEPLLRGDEIAAEAGIEPGPRLGEAVAELEAAQYAGEVADREAAAAHLRAWAESELACAAMPRDPDCIFCAIVAGEAPAEIIDSDEHTVTLMDINPATRGHALVIPREHTEDLMSISDEELCHTAVAAQRVALRMEETLQPDGFNLINACRARGLADRLPLPHPRDPPLRGRPAEAAVDPAGSRDGRDRGDRRDHPQGERRRVSDRRPDPGRA